MSRTLKMLLCLAVMVAGAALPAAATHELEVPDSCKANKLPALEENEILVEHKLFLHAGTPIAADLGEAQRAVLGNGSTGTMDATAPTMPVSSVDATASPNYAFHKNFLTGYWSYDLPETQRIVCFGAHLWGSNMGDATVQLWADDPYGVDGATVDGEASADVGDEEIAEITTYPANIDVTASQQLTLQVGGLAGLMYFDSTMHPASFTYVTVEVDPTHPLTLG